MPPGSAAAAWELEQAAGRARHLALSSSSWVMSLRAARRTQNFWSKASTFSPTSLANCSLPGASRSRLISSSSPAVSCGVSSTAVWAVKGNGVSPGPALLPKPCRAQGGLSAGACLRAGAAVRPAEQPLPALWVAEAIAVSAAC